MEDVNVSELVERLSNDEDAVRKMAVFKLQSNVGDPGFADAFMQQGGLSKLRYLVMTANGNTLAYSLTSFARLLEVDKGWESVNEELIKRISELVVTHPLVNILRGAMSILASVVSRPYASGKRSSGFGFQALKPAIAEYPQFLELLVSRLTSADHALCANALQLINALMRDAISEEEEWAKFIKKLHDLGVIKSVYTLMQSSALQDLAYPILEFQGLTKMLLRKWREVKVDLEAPDHRRSLKAIQKASTAEFGDKKSETKVSDKHKWRRVGFQSESPVPEFKNVGYLGLMDFTDFIRKQDEGFQRLLLEQSIQPLALRCPLARASLAVTAILYTHFHVDSTEKDDAKAYHALETRPDFDMIFRPLILQWSRVHTATLNSFLRLWKETGAEIEEFDKIADLVAVLVDEVVGGARRTAEVHEVEEQMADMSVAALRKAQMEELERQHEQTWGPHLHQIRDELKHEALQFMKEQRIRCLLDGSWFPNNRFVRLSHNRRYLHYADFDTKPSLPPALDVLTERVDLSTVTSVVSNVSASQSVKSETDASTKITIHGSAQGSSPSPDKEIVLLVLEPATQTLASEFLDGLLMLLNQAPITADTNRLVKSVTDYGMRIRLLNVRLDRPLEKSLGEVPARDGLDEEYWYDVFGG